MKHLIILFMSFIGLYAYATEEFQQLEFDSRYGQTLQTSNDLQDAFKNIDFLFSYNENMCGPTAFVNVMKKFRSVMKLNYYQNFGFNTEEDEIAYLINTYIPSHGVDFDPNSGVTSAVLRSMIISYLTDLQENKKFSFEVIRQDFLPMFPSPHELRGLKKDELSKSVNDNTAVLLLIGSFEAKTPAELKSWEQYLGGHWVVVGGYNKSSTNEILLIDSARPDEKVTRLVIDEIMIPNFYWAKDATTFKVRHFKKKYSDYEELNIILAAITIRISDYN